MAYEFKNSKGTATISTPRTSNLKGGRKQTIYFFARDIRPGALNEVPAAYKVIETTKTGMPILKKK